MHNCKIHANLEKLFGLSGIWFTTDGHPTAEPLVLVSVFDINKWLCLSVSQSKSQIAKGNVIVGFTYKGKFHQLSAITSDTSCGDGMLQVQFESLPLELEKEIEEYLRIDSNAERRRGVRYVVGLKENRWMHFGLKSQRQRFIIGKNMIDVVISDVSSHGSLITGEMIPSLVVGKEIVQLQVKFDNPQETLMLPALVVRVDRPIPKIAQYALSFIEPVSIRWMKRVDEYAKKF